MSKRILLLRFINRLMILKWILNEKGVESCTGFNWLRIGSIGRLLLTRKLTLGLRKRCGNSCLSELLLAPEEGLYFIEVTC